MRLVGVGSLPTSNRSLKTQAADAATPAISVVSLQSMISASYIIEAVLQDSESRDSGAPQSDTPKSDDAFHDPALLRTGTAMHSTVLGFLCCFQDVACWSMETNIVAVIFAVRFSRKQSVNYSNWERVLLVALLLAQKLIDDSPLCKYPLAFIANRNNDATPPSPRRQPGFPRCIRHLGQLRPGQRDPSRPASVASALPDLVGLTELPGATVHAGGGRPPLRGLRACSLSAAAATVPQRQPSAERCTALPAHRYGGDGQAGRANPAHREYGVHSQHGFFARLPRGQSRWKPATKKDPASGSQQPAGTLGSSQAAHP